MKKTFLLILLFVSTFGIFSFLFSSPASADMFSSAPSWTGVVPCGRTSDDSGTADIDESAPCTLCHLIVGFQKLFNFGVYLATTFALVAIFFAGVMYIVSAGSDSMMKSAKTFFSAGIIGFAIIAGSWLIVNITIWAVGAKSDLGIGISSWNKFTCSTQSTVKTTNSTSTTSTNNYDSSNTAACLNSGGECKSESECPESARISASCTTSSQVCCTKSHKQSCTGTPPWNGLGGTCRPQTQGCLSGETKSTVSTDCENYWNICCVKSSGS